MVDGRHRPKKTRRENHFRPLKHPCLAIKNNIINHIIMRISVKNDSSELFMAYTPTGHGADEKTTFDHTILFINSC